MVVGRCDAGRSAETNILAASSGVEEQWVTYEANVQNQTSVEH